MKVQEGYLIWKHGGKKEQKTPYNRCRVVVFPFCHIPIVGKPSCVFIHALFVYILQVHPYIQLTFTKIFTLNLCCFFLGEGMKHIYQTVNNNLHIL